MNASPVPFSLTVWNQYILGLQERICHSLESLDGREHFHTDEWQRREGGGGITKIISKGACIEKGGVNTSYVHGPVTGQMKAMLGTEGKKWAAAGLSMVLHPLNPHAPTFHANWRYFELYDDSGTIIDRWFGGGMDLTPYYLYEEDARHFHTVIKNSLSPFGASLYPLFKKQCDSYFNNHHRGNETRGIGGVFYDHLRSGDEYGMDTDTLFAFQQAGGQSFFEAYLPILSSRKDMPYTEEQKYWQEIRRGRYVEFNLLHDRGTLFGLKSNGRIESILMSLPPTVRFDYNYIPAEGSEEDKLLRVLQAPKDWTE